MIVRSGQPLPIRGVAPAAPAAPLDDNTINAHAFLEGCATTWLRIRNLGVNPLRVFFRRKDVHGIAPASWKRYVDIPPPGAATDGGDPAFIEGPFELQAINGVNQGGLYLMGVGGSTSFEAIAAVRIV